MLNKKVVALDIEVATLFEGASDWKQDRPLGITCAALATPRGIWTYAATDETGAFAERMTVEQCRELLDDIQTLQAGGYDIITWNGLGFDFDILGEEANAGRVCAKIALSESHIDMMYHFLCDQGYPIGLDAAAKGLGLPGKSDGIKGDLVPEIWRSHPQRVIDYVRSDALQTVKVFQLSQKHEIVLLSWISRNERINTWHAGRWLSVPEASALPLPDTSWMPDPLERESFTDWTKL